MLHEEISKVRNQTIKTTMIYIGLITAKVIFCHVVGCTIGVYNFILRKTNTVLKKILIIPKKQTVFTENKNKIRTFWGWKPSKNKSIESHQNFADSY